MRETLLIRFIFCNSEIVHGRFRKVKSFRRGFQIEKFTVWLQATVYTLLGDGYNDNKTTSFRYP